MKPGDQADEKAVVDPRHTIARAFTVFEDAV
jgi:hypothetical protein